MSPCRIGCVCCFIRFHHLNAAWCGEALCVLACGEGYKLALVLLRSHPRALRFVVVLDRLGRSAE